MKYPFIIIIFVLVLGFLINLPATTVLPENIKYAVLGGQSVKVELALSPEAQERGLSGRANLPEGEGLLFVFDRPQKSMFWMRDMNFPIDIIWITADQRIVYIEKNAKPDSYPETFGPDVYAKYVLEVPAGFADKHNLNLGNSVLFTN